MNRTIQFWMNIGSFIIILIIITGYSYYRSRDLIDGPMINIKYPTENSSVTDQDISISGNIANAVSVTLDGRKIFLDESGNFSEKLLLAPGYNIITIKAEDQFNRTAVKQLEVGFATTTSAGLQTNNIFNNN